MKFIDILCFVYLSLATGFQQFSETKYVHQY